MDRYKTDIKQEIMYRLKRSRSFDLLNGIMMDLVREGKVVNYYIAKNIHSIDMCIKHVIITSDHNTTYTITFNNIDSDYRDSVISFLLS
jgi:hypothetical protein